MPSTPGSNGAAPDVRIAVLDEYPVLVDGLADGLDATDGFSVVVRATTGHELVERLESRPCDVVVAEPWLRSDDGLWAIGEITSATPSLTVIAFSRVWDQSRVNQVLELGAIAYVPKSTSMASLPSIVRSAMDGMVTRPSASVAARDAGLTRREVEVLALAADGLDNVEIGRRLFITERTVKFHLQNAYRKLGARNRTEASALARRMGLLA